MLEVMLAAPASGSGKTIVTCALLAALKKRGCTPCAFKCGPDYIDPMFHRSVLGVESHNLDLFLSSKDTIKHLYRRYSAGFSAAVTEGVMGFYDGLGGSTDYASPWHTADTLDLPVLLVIRPKGAGLTLAAQINGLKSFRQPNHIAGIFLNDCTPMLAQILTPMLERETGLPVLGYLPHMTEAMLESRHLGLCTAGEIQDLTDRILLAAGQLEQGMDWDRLTILCGNRPNRKIPSVQTVPSSIPIAVARDEAFCFLYAETLDVLKDAGASLRFFSPLHDSCLPPDACGLYLPGGYPELYAAALSENVDMRNSIRKSIANGLPTVAECGGFLYLGQSLEGNNGKLYPMVKILPGKAIRKEKLVRFGYAELSADRDSLLFRSGEQMPVHEFHYWDSSENGSDLTASKPLTGRSWKCGFVNEHLYAAFPHLYFAGNPVMTQRFVQAAKYWEDQHGT